MSLLSAFFLWGLATISIPIAIALWNRREFRQQGFGGFFLLRKLQQSEKKRIRLLELLKLLNRILLISLLILFFADPVSEVDRLQSAENGFAILIDTSRNLQTSGEQGALMDEQLQAITSTLSAMPSTVQGAIFSVGARCQELTVSSGRKTADAERWKDFLNSNSIPYSNDDLSADSISQCARTARALFNREDLYVAYVGTLPIQFDLEILESLKIEISALLPKKLAVNEKLEITQQVEGDRIRLEYRPEGTRAAKLISASGVENLGEIKNGVDLVAAEASWLQLSPIDFTRDTWQGMELISIEQQLSAKVILWAQKETPGYLSLLAALRNYPEMKVERAIGGEVPTQSLTPVIIYGAGPVDAASLNQAWFFLSTEGASAFSVRDKKSLGSEALSGDLRRSFQIRTEDGVIQVKRYNLLDLDAFETLESFEDGAPSLLRVRASNAKQWVTPFDLEDLTTDLSLEPTFIPYLYRRLEKFLRAASEEATEASLLKPLWLAEGRSTPTESVIQRQGWPGIYTDGSQYRVVKPVALASDFHTWQPVPGLERGMQKQKISERLKVAQTAMISLFVELLLCLIPLMSAWKKKRSLAGVLMVLSLFSAASELQAANILRPTVIGYWKGSDRDRILALQQILKDADRLSNLEFKPAEEVKLDRIWNYALVFVSMSGNFPALKSNEIDQLRDYLDRGGLIVFDDPLAQSNSEFYRSVSRELGKVFPGRGLKEVSKENVLFRFFYLLNEVSGRKLASPYLEAIEFDRRTVAIFSFNDLLGAIFRSSSGDYAFSVSPYGLSQRVLAKRMLMNFFMYGITLDYKDDAIHLPHILKRRAR